MRPIIVSGVLVMSSLLATGRARAAEPNPPETAPVLASAPGVRASMSAAAPAQAVMPPPRFEPTPRSIALKFTLSPEWGYRVFRDKEPASTDRHYTASGVPGAGARLELYPLSFPSPQIDVAKDFGITAGYFRAFGLSSRDIDTNTTVDTQWYRYNFGLRFRALGGINPLSLGFTAGIERLVFDFDTAPDSRVVAVGRYTLLPIGVDARYAWGKFSLFADARFLLPLTISPPGDRAPSGTRLGFDGALAAAYRIVPVLEIELRAAYTLLDFSLPSYVHPTEHGTVLDQYIVFSAGASLVF